MRPKSTGTMTMRFRNSPAVFHMALPREEAMTRMLFITLAFLVVGYVGVVSMSIVNVIAHKEATDAAASLRGVVGGLERDYFAFSQQITAESGSSIGLAPVSGTSYVHVPGAVGVAERAPNEI